MIGKKHMACISSLSAALICILSVLTSQNTTAQVTNGMFVPSEQELPNGPGSQVELGDLDGDGDIDAFVRHWVMPNAILLNNGNGHFLVSSQGHVDERHSTSMALGDFDGDNDLDVYITFGEDPDRMLRNDGSGVFVEEAQPYGTNSMDVATGDLDGDDDLDLVIRKWLPSASSSSSSHGLVILLNDGHAGFVDSGQFLVGGKCNINLGDLDGDSDLDIYRGEVVWQNDGQGNFNPIEQSYSFYCTDAAVGDLDGDGDIDAVTADPGVGLGFDRIHINNGSGHFSVIKLNSRNERVALLDADGDYDLDAVFGSRTKYKYVFLLLNDGTGQLIDSGQRLGDGETTDIGTADLNGNGLSDLYVVNFWSADNVWFQSCLVPSINHATIQVAASDQQCPAVFLPANSYPERVVISRTVAIYGSGIDITAIQGDGDGSIFHIEESGKLQLANLAIVGGVASRGGALFNDGGSVWATNVAVRGNQADSGAGIFIDNGGLVNFDNCTFDGNEAVANGGAVFQNTGILTMTNCLIENNSAISSGGGFYNTAGNAFIQDSSLVGNVADNGAGLAAGLSSYIDVVDSELLNNEATSSGGALTNDGGNLTITTSWLDGNTAISSGGAVYNNAGLTVIQDSFVSNNRANGGGGVQVSGGMVNIKWSKLDDNRATIGGGAVYNGNEGDVSIYSSSFMWNWIDGESEAGGAIANYGSMTINNSTIGRNYSVAGHGGALANCGTLDLASSSLDRNSASLSGGNLYICDTAPSTRIANTILSNSIAGDNCGDLSPTSFGYNLDGDGTCQLSAPGDISEIDPQIWPMRQNNGPTLTGQLLINSPAIDAGNPAILGSTWDACPTVDQRGVDRGIDGDADGEDRCDIGAYEFDDPEKTDSAYQSFLPLISHHFCSSFFDDFSTVDSGWPVSNDSYALREYLDGEYRILSRQAGYLFLSAAPSCGNELYYVDVDARWVGEPGQGYGLLFGLNAEFTRFYFMEVRPDISAYRLYNYEGSLQSYMPPIYLESINSGQKVNHLRVKYDDGYASAEINGHSIPLSDNEITGLTFVGVGSTSYGSQAFSDARFDNFSVSKIPGRLQLPHILSVSGAAHTNHLETREQSLVIPETMQVPFCHPN